MQRELHENACERKLVQSKVLKYRLLSNLESQQVRKVKETQKLQFYDLTSLLCNEKWQTLREMLKRWKMNHVQQEITVCGTRLGSWFCC